jgi:hypothetical protein
MARRPEGDRNPLTRVKDPGLCRLWVAAAQAIESLRASAGLDRTCHMNRSCALRWRPFSFEIGLIFGSFGWGRQRADQGDCHAAADRIALACLPRDAGLPDAQACYCVHACSLVGACDALCF